MFRLLLQTNEKPYNKLLIKPVCLLLLLTFVPRVCSLVLRLKRQICIGKTFQTLEQLVSATPPFEKNYRKYPCAARVELELTSPPVSDGVFSMSRIQCRWGKSLVLVLVLKQKQRIFLINLHWIRLMDNTPSETRVRLACVTAWISCRSLYYPGCNTG